MTSERANQLLNRSMRPSRNKLYQAALVANVPPIDLAISSILGKAACMAAALHRVAGPDVVNAPIIPDEPKTGNESDPTPGVRIPIPIIQPCCRANITSRCNSARFSPLRSALSNWCSSSTSFIPARRMRPVSPAKMGNVSPTWITRRTSCVPSTTSTQTRASPLLICSETVSPKPRTICSIAGRARRRTSRRLETKTLSDSSEAPTVYPPRMGSRTTKPAFSRDRISL